MRWNTVSCSTSGAIAGITWIAEAPVPITATRLPARLCSGSQRAVCIVVPAKLWTPSMSGSLGWVRTPVASTTWRATSVSPPSVARRQPLSGSSNVAAVIRVPNRTLSRNPKRSAQYSA